MIALYIVSYLLAACLTFASASERSAICVLTPNNGSEVQGIIIFKETEYGVYITGNVTCLSPGLHGFHIHEKGDLSDGCTSTGPHYNPEHRNHGRPYAKDSHAGDLPQLEADKNGIAYVETKSDKFSLFGEYSVIGRAVVVHEKRDDYGKGGQPDSLTTGASGNRIACGVIGIQEPITPWTDSAAAHAEIGVAFTISALLAAFLVTEY